MSKNKIKIRKILKSIVNGVGLVVDPYHILKHDNTIVIKIIYGIQINRLNRIESLALNRYILIYDKGGISYKWEKMDFSQVGIWKELPFGKNKIVSILFNFRINWQVNYRFK